MATITFAGASGIRDDLVTDIEALTPATRTRGADPGYLFRRCPDKTVPLRDWALRTPPSCFRRFEVRSEGADEDAPWQNPTEYEVNEKCSVLVAYPARAVGLYGAEDTDDLDRVMESDADQLRDAIWSTDNYPAGVHKRQVVARRYDRTDPTVWFVELAVIVTYAKAQSL